jgi:NAD(P)H-flavin reductase
MYSSPAGSASRSSVACCIAEEDLPHRVTLIYSNRDRDSTPFLDELSQLERTRDAFQLVLTMTNDPSWDGETRRIGPALLRDHLADDLGSYAYLVAGPPQMVNAIVEKLQAEGIPEEQLSADRFSGY